MLDYLRSRFGAIERLVVLDVHTGLGRSGEDALFVDGARMLPDDVRALRTAFGPRLTDVAARSEYRVRGAFAAIYPLALPTATVHALTQEIGTYPPAAMLTALRDENRWHHYGNGTMAHPSKARL